MAICPILDVREYLPQSIATIQDEAKKLRTEFLKGNNSDPDED
jgi:hypothetical protein